MIHSKSHAQTKSCKDAAGQYLSLSDVKATAEAKVITRRQNDTWVVDYTSDADTPLSLTLIIIDNVGREIKFVDG